MNNIIQACKERSMAPDFGKISEGVDLSSLLKKVGIDDGMTDTERIDVATLVTGTTAGAQAPSDAQRQWDIYFVKYRQEAGVEVDPRTAALHGVYRALLAARGNVTPTD